MRGGRRVSDAVKFRTEKKNFSVVVSERRKSQIVEE